MATNDEIYRWFGILKLGADSIAGSDLKEEAERAQVRALADAALHIIESVVVDINNIAFYMREENERRARDG